MSGREHRRWVVLVAWALWCGLASGQQFGGGTGEPNNPYLITSAQDLIDLGNTPEVYDKHFRLTADIDLSGITFDQAVIAKASRSGPRGEPRGETFSGTFDGNGHVIRHLHIQGEDYLGLFGCLGTRAVICNLGIEDSSIEGMECVGSLAGESAGMVTDCYATGTVAGYYLAGGLIGRNDEGRVSGCHSSGEVSLRWEDAGGLVGSNSGVISNCHSAAEIKSEEGFNVGGLVGWNSGSVSSCYSTGTITGYAVAAGGLIGQDDGGWVWNCYSSGAVSGWDYTGGLIGSKGGGFVSGCFSTGAVDGHDIVGGLIGYEGGCVSNCYCTGHVAGNEKVGGLIGGNSGTVLGCFWDSEASEVTVSAGGTGLTTGEMQEMGTYLDAGWDLADEHGNGTAETWRMPQSGGYPRLSLFDGYEHARPQGRGTLAEPFLIRNAQELGTVGYHPLACYRLEADVDLSGITWSIAPIPWFGGHFDGNGHVVRRLDVRGGGYLGLFGTLDHDAVVWHLGLEDARVQGANGAIGSLTGWNRATLTGCYSSGSIEGSALAGGLVGYNEGDVLNCYALNAVSARRGVGGLIGNNSGCVSNCYSAGAITWDDSEERRGPIAGGLIGDNYEGGIVAHCYWDTETSGLATSDGGVGLTTAEMQEMSTYLDSGWDFADEADNGTSETWKIPRGGGYPRLSMFEGYEPVVPEGEGTMTEPFLIRTAAELGSIGRRPLACYRLENNVDLSETTSSVAPIPFFGGRFDGNGHAIRDLRIDGTSLVGLFGSLAAGAVVTDLGLEGGSIQGTGDYVGALAGRSDGALINCYSASAVSGGSWGTGGLVGYNRSGSVLECHNTGTVVGQRSATGGIIGYNSGNVSRCRNAGEVTGDAGVGGVVGKNGGRVSTCHNGGAINGNGGIVGYNWGTVSKCSNTGPVLGDGKVGGVVGGNYVGVAADCYSTGTVTGNSQVGGLVGNNERGIVRDCYSAGAVSGNHNVGGLIGKDPGYAIGSFWDIEASGVTVSAGGTGLTTAEMMDPEWIGLQGWADNPAWVLDPHQDYPRLAWEGTSGQAIPEPIIDWMAGNGTSDAPYEISDVSQLLTIGRASLLRGKSLVLVADLDMAGIVWPRAALPDFSGSLDGHGHAIRNLSISGREYLGLVGRLEKGGTLLRLGLVDVNVVGSGESVGALVGRNARGHVSDCHSTGLVRGGQDVGGLVGDNDHGSVFNCYSLAEVAGEQYSDVGGLVGNNRGSVLNCYTRGEVTGGRYSDIGGLVGLNQGSVSNCYSSGTVGGNGTVGGLVGKNWYYYSDPVEGCFWDIETSGLVVSDGGTGLTTTEMWDINTYVEAGWDFLGEADNGAEDVWWIEDGQGYPRLWWELTGFGPMMSADLSAQR